MNFVGILAGGIGSRMGSSLPKQFIKIGGVPIIIRTVNTFLNSPETDRLVVAMNPDWMNYCAELFDEYKIDKSKISVISGGTTRFLSMVNIVDECIEQRGDKLSDDDILCIHDCARPFVNERIIKDNFEKVREYGMVTTSVPTVDTVLIAKDGKESSCVPERSNVFCDQGPQTFFIRQFKEIQQGLTPEETEAYMEAGRMYLEKGRRVGIVEGDRMNFKMTTDFDIAFAEFLLEKGLIV